MKNQTAPGRAIMVRSKLDRCSIVDMGREPGLRERAVKLDSCSIEVKGSELGVKERAVTGIQHKLDSCSIVVKTSEPRLKERAVTGSQHRLVSCSIVVKGEMPRGAPGGCSGALIGDKLRELSKRKEVFILRFDRVVLRADLDVVKVEQDILV